MAKVFRRPAAQHDLIAHYIYLAENANEATAARFLTNAEASFNDLAKQPKMGAPLTLRLARLGSHRQGTRFTSVGALMADLNADD